MSHEPRPALETGEMGAASPLGQPTNFSLGRRLWMRLRGYKTELGRDGRIRGRRYRYGCRPSPVGSFARSLRRKPRRPRRSRARDDLPGFLARLERRSLLLFVVAGTAVYLAATALAIAAIVGTH